MGSETSQMVSHTSQLRTGSTLPVERLLGKRRILRFFLLLAEEGTPLDHIYIYMYVYKIVSFSGRLSTFCCGGLQGRLFKRKPTFVLP